MYGIFRKENNPNTTTVHRYPSRVEHELSTICQLGVTWFIGPSLLRTILEPTSNLVLLGYPSIQTSNVLSTVDCMQICYIYYMAHGLPS